MWKITEVKRHERTQRQHQLGERWDAPTREYNKEPRVYFEPKKADGQSETVLDSLINRRSRPYEEWRPLVKKALKRIGVELDERTKIAWSKHAGCMVCPCSPGFILKNEQGHFDVWVTVEPRRAAEPAGDESPSERGDAMRGKHIVLTGKMEEKRAVLAEMIEARGGIVQSSVTNATNFLVRNPLPDGHESTKTRKAGEKGVTILTEEQLMAAL